MSELNPCPSCNRHVRAADVVCPFCSAPQPSRSPRAEALPRPRLNRAAIFAAGAALAGMSACSSTANPTDAGVGGATGGGTGGDTGGVGGAGGAGGAGGSAHPDGGPVPIYSAVFPPPKPPKTRNG